jgi:hypothetical protein
LGFGHLYFPEYWLICLLLVIIVDISTLINKIFRKKERKKERKNTGTKVPRAASLSGLKSLSFPHPVLIYDITQQLIIVGTRHCRVLYIIQVLYTNFIFLRSTLPKIYKSSAKKLSFD